MKIKPLYLYVMALLCLFLTAFAFIGVQDASITSVRNEVSMGMTRAAFLDFIPTTTPNLVISTEPEAAMDSVVDEAVFVQADQYLIEAEGEESSYEVVDESLQELSPTTDSSEISQAIGSDPTMEPTQTLAVVMPEVSNEDNITENVPGDSEAETRESSIIEDTEKTEILVALPEGNPEDGTQSGDDESSPVRPTMDPGLADYRTNTPAPEDVETQVQTKTPVPTMTPTAVPTKVPTQAPTDEPDYFWFAGHEDGTISEWEEHGDFLRQGNTGLYSVVKTNPHSGQYAVKLQINTATGSGNQAAYLFYWDELPNAAYYSAWYYIPEDTIPGEWWNLMQWKSTYNGNSDYSRPMFVLDASVLGKMKLSLCHLPDGPEKICMTQNIVSVPKGQWFHIEAYYKRDPVKGRFIVWQDGVKLYDIDYLPTVLSDETLHWSVNTYTPAIFPSPSYILIDDAAIAFERVGP